MCNKLLDKLVVSDPPYYLGPSKNTLIIYYNEKGEINSVNGMVTCVFYCFFLFVYSCLYKTSQHRGRLDMYGFACPCGLGFCFYEALWPIFQIMWTKLLRKIYQIWFQLEEIELGGYKWVCLFFLVILKWWCFERSLLLNLETFKENYTLTFHIFLSQEKHYPIIILWTCF